MGGDKMSEVKKSWKDKASTQNAVAFIVVVSATLAGIAYSKWELVSLIVGAALVYLYPKKEES
jgi:hypothetical protein